MFQHFIMFTELVNTFEQFARLVIGLAHKTVSGEVSTAVLCLRIGF